ncbi:MAG: uroporphyrinogen decarboxylase family protein [Tannerella sp.]|jgi:hypothetical protein|nr:uroporphyrinogen decarboxylase family protein [Tannerella sp.]
MKQFDITKRDSQATEITPVSPERFDLDAYAAYENELLKKTGAFWKARSGVAVYRRMRAAEVFADGSRDMQRSLALQLGCLQKSMEYKADIPNFLEPWYGIGVYASAYGIDYVWNPGQAPASHYRFETVAEALQYEPQPVAQTAVGKHVLEMIDYFMNRTKGKLPLCFTDAQSPLNTSTLTVNTESVMMDMILDPGTVKRFLDTLAGLMIDFVAEQKKLIGECLVNPGHSFASARNFDGYGQSDDNIVMLSNRDYLECAVPSFEKVGQAYGGPVLHSCGDYSNKLPVMSEIKGLRMMDAAFSPETDPNPNPALPFAETLAGSGIVLNARIVGDIDVIKQTVRQLWRPGMKLIVVTYCQTPEEQERVYDAVHEICGQ